MKEFEKEIDAKAEVKEKIILKSLELFRDHGIKSIRMDDIANSLKMSKRTLYEIFTDKETLLEECILYHQATSREAIKDLVANSTNVLEVILECYQGSVEAYHKVNKSFFEDIQKYPKAYELIKNDREKDNQVVIDFLKQGVEQGLFRNDINFDILQTLVREQIKLLMNTTVCDKYDFLEVYESIMFIYLRGISTDMGVKELDTFINEYRDKKTNKSNQD